MKIYLEIFILIFCFSEIKSKGATVNIRVFIEGFYLGSGTMTAVVDPIGQPFICDSITVKLLDTVPNYVQMDSSKSVISTTGFGSFYFPNITMGRSYYIQVVHRNSLTIFSKYPVYINDTSLFYDFTRLPLQLCNTAKDSGDGFALMYSGDLNQDGFFDVYDYVIFDAVVYNHEVGYSLADLNGDHILDQLDFSIYEFNNMWGFWAGFPSNCVSSDILTPKTEIGYIELFPNPASSKISFRTNIVINSIDITDMKGEKLLSFQKVNNGIDISNLSAGIFILTIHTDKQDIYKRIIRM